MKTTPLATGHLSRRAIARSLAALGVATVSGLSPVLATTILAKDEKPSYRIIDLGVLPQGNYSIGHAINAAHHVAGMAKTSGDSRAVVRRGDDLVEISGQPVAGSAQDLNDTGQVVGYLTSEIGARATLWRDGETIDLGTFGGTTGVAHGLNNAGIVVGDASTETGLPHAFRWVDGVMTDLGTLGGDFSSAQDVNEAGQIVGLSSKSAGDAMYGPGTIAVVWQESGVVEIPALGGAANVAAAINAAGVVVGGSTTEAAVEYGGVGTHAFKWDDGDLYDLGAFDGTNVSVANDINAAGWIVGFGGNAAASSPDDAMVACVWSPDGQMWDLNERVEDKDGWTLSAAIGINDDGWITGYGVAKGQFRGFILKPR